MKTEDFAKFQDLVKQREQLEQELDKFQKLLTVSFVDIVGSTRYFEEHGDVAGMVFVQNCMDILSPIAEKHAGTICKTIGDALMTSYENPTAAVLCAIDMQLAVENYNKTQAKPGHELKVRIGLNYGKGVPKEKDVFGDVVNTAARIEASAKGDQIFISGELEKLIREAKIAMQKMPDLAAKGKEKPVTIYEVLWQKDKSGKPMPSKLPSPTVAGRTPVKDAEKPPSGTVVLNASAFADLLRKPVIVYSLVIVRPDGTHGQSYKIDKQVCVLGRVEGDILFGDDQLVSRRHAQFTITNEGLVVEDLKSANGVYRRLRKNHPLKDGEIILMGRQMFRFANPDAGNKSPSGKFTKDDLKKPAELIRILPGGIEEAHYALPPGENVLGRTKGTINFPEDAYLSSQHARVRNNDGSYSLEDLQAVNGTFIAVHEPTRLEDGDILLIGHQLLRVTSTAPN